MAVIAGAVYGLLYFFWLHKYDYVAKTNSEASTDQGEGEKLTKDENDKEIALKEIQNAERLSLMIRFNHRGSLTSLDRGSRPDLHRTSSYRRSSTLELSRVSQSKASSSSKVDLLKSTLEINLNKNSNPQLNQKASSPPPLTRHTTKVNNEPAVTINALQTNRKSTKNIPQISDELRNRRDSIPEEEEELIQKTDNIKANIKPLDIKTPDSIKDT
uniref:Uncharacterized protein n=3 Tax=Clastoptera arizonana TaxID=38151 RepID=A0A1B6CZ09_9HEMI